MKIRGLNKKGQEVVSNFGVVGIVGIIFLVVVILGIWYVSTRAGEASTQIPENAAIIASACSAVASESTLNSYCLQLREVNSNKYATCDKMSDYNIIVTDSDGTSIKINEMNLKCQQYDDSLQQKIQEACVSGDFKGKPSVEINKKLCSDYIDDMSCSGSATSCNSLTSTTCGSQQGCSLNSETTKCEGTVVSCDKLSIATCESQKGCELKGSKLTSNTN
jgi:hypothetical protein